MAKNRPKNDAEWRERAEEYLAAAREHHAALVELPEEPKHYPLAYYLAGLAVECLFRAYTELVNGEHDSRHDLRKHAEGGRFLEFMPSDQRDDIRADIADIQTRWQNNHRYRSLTSLKRFLNGSELYRLEGGRSIKGNRIVRFNWEILLEASLRLLTNRNKAMGTLKDTVESLVTENLPGATTELEEIPRLEKLSGYVVWAGFAGKLQRERQRELWAFLRGNLEPQEEKSLSAILTLTPAEMRTLSDENN